MSDQPAKLCERCCVVSPNKGERFCKDCRKHVLQELYDSGAIRPVAGPTRLRTREQMENTRETKYGKDQG